MATRRALAFVRSFLRFAPGAKHVVGVASSKVTQRPKTSQLAVRFVSSLRPKTSPLPVRFVSSCPSLRVLTRPGIMGASSSCCVRKVSTPSGGKDSWKSNPELVGVLDFWYGENYSRDEKALDSKDYLASRKALWWAGSKETDEKAAKFSALIESVGEGKAKGSEWETPQGYLARIVLLDQLTRNVYRGTAEAFQYDNIARELTKGAINKGFMDNFKFPELQFALMPLMHSENIEDHKLFSEILTSVQRRVGPQYEQVINMMAEFAKHHRSVVEQFGRYPHRNPILGRESTEEEEAWLASDDKPAWAKITPKK